MCGIVGYVGARQALPILTRGLSRLEYRGYDSAGVAVLDSDLALRVHKREGKLQALVDAVVPSENPGSTGIGHTRWATHGAPTQLNAHPHSDQAGRIVLVHNGIIENYASLKAELAARGVTFVSETDTEVLAQLVAEAYEAATALSAGPATMDHRPGQGPDPTTSEASDNGPIREPALALAVRQALAQVEGAYAIAVMAADAPGLVVGARHFSPLVVGLGQGENYLASDIPALIDETRCVMLIEDGEVASLTPEGVLLTALDGTPVDRAPFEVTWTAEAASKGGYEHFVRKEIDEEPQALGDALLGRLVGDGVQLPELEGLDLSGVTRAMIVACGSSYYAGLVGKLQLERWTRLPTEVAVASELRYGDPVLGADTLVILISQSGETADTLAAMRLAKAAGAPTLGLCNVVGSSLTRSVDATLFLQVGPEVGVVATKTFTGQLALLAVLSLHVALKRGTMDAAAVAEIVEALRRLPEDVARLLGDEPAIRAVAERYVDRHSMFFLGRGFGFPVALEGALKLKEISYIHAEGYPAGELKHGPIAMLDPSIPVVAIATQGPVHGKMVSNIEEVRARGAEILAVATEGDRQVEALSEAVFWLPKVPDALMPLAAVIPLQLFAYHIAVLRGTDVDQPRNLAKSVTVE